MRTISILQILKTQYQHVKKGHTIEPLFTRYKIKTGKLEQTSKQDKISESAMHITHTA